MLSFAVFVSPTAARDDEIVEEGEVVAAEVGAEEAEVEGGGAAVRCFFSGAGRGRGEEGEWR